MPNVEVHVNKAMSDDEAEAIRTGVEEVIKTKLPDYLVIGAVTSIVCDETREVVGGKLAPFLRICTSDPTHAEAVSLVKVLHPLGYGIETMRTEKYYPPLKEDE